MVLHLFQKNIFRNTSRWLHLKRKIDKYKINDGECDNDTNNDSNNDDYNISDNNNSNGNTGNKNKNINNG